MTLKPVLPRPSKPAREEKVLPPERMLARPRQMYMVPRVAMKGATFSLVMTMPLTQPMKAPMSRTMKMIMGTLKYRVLFPMVRPSWIRPPAIIPARPTTEPTDRSMPPVMMT